MTRSLADEFRRYLGGIPVSVAVTVSLVAGAASIALLRSRDWGHVDILDWSARGAVGAAVAALGFTFIAVVADRTIGFGADVNVRWPLAFAFYPTIAVVAEVVFHLVPLAALTLVLGLRFGDGLGTAGYVCLVIVALIETAYQVAASRRAAAPGALVTFVGVHLFVIGATEMMLLWRFGVAAMILFRLVYYAGWHIVWGRLRLADR